MRTTSDLISRRRALSHLRTTRPTLLDWPVSSVCLLAAVSYLCGFLTAAWLFAR